MSGVRRPPNQPTPTTNAPIISVPLDGYMTMKGGPNWHSTSLGYYKEDDSKSGTPKEVKWMNGSGVLVVQ